MKTSKILLTTAAMTLVTLLGVSNMASAQPGYRYGHMGMSNQQMTDMQQIRRSHWEKMQPLMQQRSAKMDEMDQLMAAGTAPNDAKVTAVQKELRDIDAKLYAADADMRKQMVDKDIPYMGGRGMGRHHGMGGMGMGGMGMGPCGNFYGTPSER